MTGRRRHPRPRYVRTAAGKAGGGGPGPEPELPVPGAVAFWDTRQAATGVSCADLSGEGNDLLLAAGVNEPLFLDYDGTTYCWLSSRTGDSIQIQDMLPSTLYDYVVTYLDTTSAAGQLSSNGFGQLTFGDGNPDFGNKSIVSIAATPNAGGATTTVDFTVKTAYVDLTFDNMRADDGKDVRIFRVNGGFKTEIVYDRPVYQFYADDWLEAGFSPTLQFDETESFTVVAVYRVYNGIGEPFCTVIGNKPSGAITPGYQIRANSSSGRDVVFDITDTGTRITSLGTAPQGLLSTQSGVCDRTTPGMVLYIDKNPQTGQNIGGLGSLANANPLRVGSTTSNDENAEMSWYGGGVWPRDLVPGEIDQLVDFFAQVLEVAAESAFSDAFSSAYGI